MDVRYKNIQTSSYTISVVFAGIYIADVSIVYELLFSIFFFLHGTNFKISVFICTALFQIKINPLKKKRISYYFWAFFIGVALGMHDLGKRKVIHFYLN